MTPNHHALNRDRFIHEDDERSLGDRYSDEACDRGDYEYELLRDNELIAELEAKDAKP